MKIVIIGDGKVGHKLTTQLSEENYDVVLIDQNEGKLKEAVNKLDIFCITGNGADVDVQRQADVPHADLVIACASTDELNMLSCLLAKRLGARHTIARVRNPIYYRQIDLLKEDLHLSMAVNPERTAANEIARVLLFPETSKVETFMKGRVELVEFIVREDSALAGLSLAEVYRKFQIKILVCAVKRGQKIYIPDGEFILEKGDKMHIVAAHQDLKSFFRALGHRNAKVKKVLICGGGHVCFYLAMQLLQVGMQVKIIEQRKERCEELSVLLPKAMIINGDGTDKETLVEEGLERAGGFVTLTGLDEENVILSLFAKTCSKAKLVTKIKHINFNEVINELDLDTVIYPQNITAEYILQYVRAKQNAQGDNVETLYKIIDDQAEALEFRIQGEGAVTGVSLEQLSLKPNILIACISRGGQAIIPKGSDCMLPGDSVIVVTTNHGLKDISDILKTV